MVTAFIIDFPVSILIGFIYSFFKADVERDDPFYRFASFWWGLIAASMYAATAYLAYGLWPNWMWMWYIEPFPITAFGWMYIFFLMYAVPYVMGYLLGSHGRRESWGVLYLSIFVVLISLYFLMSEFWHGRYKNLDGGLTVLQSSEWLNLFIAGSGAVTTLTITSLLISRYYYTRAIESGEIIKQLLHPGKRRTLQKIAEAMLPDDKSLRSISGKDLPLAEIFSEHLADFNILNRLMVRLSIDVINFSPLLFKGIPYRFEFISHEKQVALLESIENHKNILMKVPLIFIKTFMLQFFYNDQRALDDIGYVGEGLGIARPHLRWHNAPPYEVNERSIVWSKLTNTIRKTSK